MILFNDNLFTMTSENTKIYAVIPYAHNGKPSFKQQPYDAWVEEGGKTASPHYPPKWLHAMAYKFSLPVLRRSKSEARLRFVEAVSMTFDTFPDYLSYEIVPMIWDCWPQYFGRVAKWLRRNRVRTAIFTSTQTAENMRREFPGMNILSVTEGIDVMPYHEGEILSRRGIDLLEYGSPQRNFFRNHVAGVNHIDRANGAGKLDTLPMLLDAIADAKVTIALPRCDTDYDATGGVETLTQRFWECMLSRTVLLGRAPQELIDAVGYNPVVSLDRGNADAQVRSIVSRIDDYQPLVDKNRQAALRLAPWTLRMKRVMDWLSTLGYKV